MGNRSGKNADGFHFLSLMQALRQLLLFFLGLLQGGDVGADGRDIQKIIIDHIHYWEPIAPKRPYNQDEIDEYIFQSKTRSSTTLDS